MMKKAFGKIRNNVTLQKGFTIVELLIVIVIIGILAAITIIAYNGVTGKASITDVQSTLQQAAKKLELSKTTNSDQYPLTLSTAGINVSGNTTLSYLANGLSYCLTGTNGSLNYYVSPTTGSPQVGSCPTNAMQGITNANCPTTRTRAVDARDNHTYWVQQLADGKCWMLTNLAYAGDGANTFADVKTLTNGTSTGSPVYNPPSYYVVPSTTNFTTEPTNPSTSTNGTGQYGYLYNWCAAMAYQSTGVCANAIVTNLNTSISICPSGWRLPTGNGGEFTALNTAVNGGNATTDVGLRTNWLMQYGGAWVASFSLQGTDGYYWSSSIASNASIYSVDITSNSVGLINGNIKHNALAVRCVAM